MDAFEQKVRWYVYDYFVKQARPPTIAETSAGLSVPLERVQLAYRHLHQQHAFFLEPGRDEIRMANPLSAVPTQFLVHAGGRSYWANCAWDALSIPAMLRLDATIEAVCADCQEPLVLTVAADQVQGRSEIIHFALPLRQWYEDLIFT